MAIASFDSHFKKAASRTRLFVAAAPQSRVNITLT